MKKLTHSSKFAIMALAVASTTMTGCGGGGTKSTTSSNTDVKGLTVEQNEANRIKAEALVAEVEQKGHLVLGNDGTVSVTTPDSLSPEAKSFALAALAQTNKHIRAGEVVAHPDLTFTEPTTARANEQSVKRWGWWGTRYAINSTNTNRIVAALGAGSLASGVAGAVPLSILYGVGAFFLGYANAPGYGVFIYTYDNVLPVWCAGQPR